MRRQSLARGLAVVAAALLLSGCAAPIVAGMTLGTLSTIASVVSTAVTGKDWSDHALSWVTGKNCNVTEGILRKNRKICEERGSLAAAEDFQGIFVAFGGKDADPLQRFASARQTARRCGVTTKWRDCSPAIRRQRRTTACNGCAYCWAI